MSGLIDKIRAQQREGRNLRRPVGLTDEEWEKEQRKHGAVFKEFYRTFNEIVKGKCSHCGDPMTQRQAGGCVVAEPCGHRLFRGTLYDAAK